MGFKVYGRKRVIRLVDSVVLLSGGLDSSTVLALARSEGSICHAFTVLYGQRHKREIESAKAVADSLGVQGHTIVELPGNTFSGSALTDNMGIPTTDNTDTGISASIPVTYVPARNLVFLSLAVGMAEVLEADSVYAGVNAVDYSGYPDCRPEFIKSFEKAANLATKRGIQGNPVEIKTPLIDMTKAEIVKLGASLGLDHSLTWSCYKGGEKACGKCDSCMYRLKGFREAGIEDPIEYECIGGGH